METLYRKVAVSEILPENIEMLMTSHGWSLWNGDQFEDDKPISYINYWLEEIPDNESALIKRNEELEAMLEKVIEINKHHNFNGHLVNDQITELLNK